MEKRKIYIIVAALAIVAASVGLMSFLTSQKEEPEPKKAVEAKKFVRTQVVDYEDVQTDVKAFGRVQTAQSLDLLSEVSGRMFEGNIRLKEGQSFKKGTLLFYIDDTEALLDIKAQKSNFLRDIAAILPDMKIDYSESYSTWSKYFSAIDIDKDLPELPKSASEKEKTFLATKGTYSTFYTIKSAEARLKKHWYYAPFDGSVSEVALESGAFVNSGTRIGKILRTGLHELKIAVETKDIPWIRNGSPVSIYSSETQLSWKGEVARISDYVNQNTQSVDVYVRIFSNGQKIYDGQFVEASIPAEIIKNGMIIPRNAIYNGSEIFVLEDTLLKRKPIEIHRVMDETVVFSGLDEGSNLVVEPLVNAHNNMKAYKMEETNIDLEAKENKKKELPDPKAKGAGRSLVSK